MTLQSLDNQLELFLLGPPELRLNGQRLPSFSTRKAQALLIYLAMTERTHTRDELATLFWPNAPSTKARKNLRDALSHLRRVVDPFLQSTPQTIRFNPEQGMVSDVATLRSRFSMRHERVVVDEDGSSAAPTTPYKSAPYKSTSYQNTSHQIAYPESHAITELYRGEFLQGFSVRGAPAFDNWVSMERENLHQLAIRGMVELLPEMLIGRHYGEHNGGHNGGHYEDAMPLCNRLLLLEPWNEDAHCAKMTLLHQSGQRAAALAQYQTYSAILDHEFGSKPADSVTRLFREIESGQIESGQVENEQTEAPSTAQIITLDDVALDDVILHDDSQPSVRQGSELPARSISHNIKSHLTPFVGRRSEVEHIFGNFFQLNTRLLTIVGPGGIGKTKLANHIAAWAIQCSEEDPASDQPTADFEGVYFIPLEDVHAQIEDPTFLAKGEPPYRDDGSLSGAAQGIITAISNAIELRFSDHRPPAEQLLNALQERCFLLILDNFEHLIPDAAIVDWLLDAAPNLYIIITSRQRLRLDREELLTLGGLSWEKPSCNQPNDLAGGQQPSLQSSSSPPWNDAMLLFLSRSQLTRHTIPHSLVAEVGVFEQHAGNQTSANRRSAVNVHNGEPTVSFPLNGYSKELVSQIQQICELVEGMPLAIELAAALSHSMPVADIAKTLVEDYDILECDLSGLKDGHTSIRVMLDTSWRKLSAVEKQTLARLSIFHGGFTLDAAAAVAAPKTPVLETPVLETPAFEGLETENTAPEATPPRVVAATAEILSRLVDKSFVRLVDSRYEMHALIQRYAADQLATTDAEKSSVTDQYQDYFASLLHYAIADWHQHYDIARMDGLLPEMNNLAAVWELLLATGDIASLSEYLDDLWTFYRIRTRLPEAITMIEQALAAIDHSVGETQDDGTPLPFSAAFVTLSAKWHWYLSEIYLDLGELEKSDLYARSGLQRIGYHDPKNSAYRAIKIITQAFVQMANYAWSNYAWSNYAWSNGAWSNGVRPSHKPLSKEDKRVAIAAQLYRRLQYNSYVRNTTTKMVYYGLRHANLADLCTDPSIRAVAYGQMSLLCGMLNMNRAAEYYIALSHQCEQACNDLAGKALSAICAGLYYLSVGRWAEAEEHLFRAHHFNERTGNWFGAGNCIALLNTKVSRQGDYKQSLAYGLMLEQRATLNQNSTLLAWAYRIQAASLINRGQADQALPLLEMAIPHSDHLLVNDIAYVTGYAIKALAHFATGEYLRAEEAAEHSLTCLTRTKPTSIIHFYCFDCLLTVYAGLWRRSLQKNMPLLGTHRHYQKRMASVMRMFERYGWHHPTAKPGICLFRGYYNELLGNEEKAMKQLRKGLPIAKAQGQYPFEGRLHLEIGRRFPLNHRERNDHLQRACQIFTQCDMQNELAQARDALKTTP